MVLFLDFDGVLHPDAVYLIGGRPTLRAEGALFMWAPLLIEVLEPHPEVRIVLSTSWARELRFDRARDCLPEALRQRVIGATWHSGMGRHPEGWYRHDGPTWWDHATRYAQIHRYVQRASLTQWLAIDDQPEGWVDAHRQHLIHTHSDTGLSDPAVLDRLRAALRRTADSPG